MMSDVSSLFISDVEEASSQIRKFLNCIINFNEFSLLVTSFDAFFHNHKYGDDCAQPLSTFHQVPTAKVSRKNYTNKYFTEISVFVGLYELLIVGGYILRDGSISSFLGSSIKNIELKEETTVQIRVPAASSGCVATTRLLNQYIKRHSHELWEFNCAQLFSKGFYPISPIKLMNHDSQKAKPVNNNHFKSAVLNMITYPRAIQKSDLDELWLLAIRLPFFKEKINAANPGPNNFTEMSDLLKVDNDTNYISSLVHVLGNINSKVPCFFAVLYKETVAKDIALKIVTSGLKDDINNQHNDSIKKFKNSL